MTKVAAGITTSLDGYITGPNDGPGRGLGHCDPDPELAQLMQGCGGGVQVVDHAGLGDLQREPARVQPGGGLPP